MNINTIAENISNYLGAPLDQTYTRLMEGFHANHARVAQDFLNNNVDINNPDSLLNWYRNTDAYIWELSSYHLNVDFNYMGMCEGIAKGFAGTGRKNVLSLGDGIGTLCIRMAEEGLNVTYNDLKDGKTAGFAQYRFSLQPDLKIKTLFTEDWNPVLGVKKFDAVVALDFFEHLINVDEWVMAVFKCLKPNGAFIAQNAFGIGDIEHGNSIPMHLPENNKYQTEWAPLLNSVGFIQDSQSGWWIKP